MDKILLQMLIEYPIYLRTNKFKIGYVPQYGGYFHDLTLLENLIAIGEILVPNKKIRDEKTDSLISKFELDAVRKLNQAIYLVVKKNDSLWQTH